MKRYVLALCTAVLILAPLTAESSKKKAYILIGDMEQGGYSQFFQSVYYTYGLSKNSDIHDQMKELIAAKRKEYEAKGYEVVMVDNAIAQNLKKALNDTDTDALVFFGHGIEGALSMADGQMVSPKDIVIWRQEKYARDNGIPVNRDGTISWTDLKKKYGDEQAKKWREIWKKRPDHYDINDAYFHTCNSLENNALVDAIMSNNGDFTGFKGTGYWSQAMDNPDNIRGYPTDRNFLNALRNFQDSSGINMPDDAHVVVFKDEEGQTRWNVTWTDDRTGKEFILVIWSDKNGRVTGSDFREANDMKNVLDNMGGDYKPIKSGVLLPGSPGGVGVKWQNTSGVSLVPGTDSSENPAVMSDNGDKNFVNVLRNYQDSSNINIPDDAHVVVFTDEEGQTRWNVTWTDDRTGKEFILVIWSDKNGRVTGSDFREANDMKNVLDNMGGDYKPIKSGALLPGSPGGVGVKWQNTSGVSLVPGTDSSKTPDDLRAPQKGWDKVYEGWDKVYEGWDRVY